MRFPIHATNHAEYRYASLALRLLITHIQNKSVKELGTNL